MPAEAIEFPVLVLNAIKDQAARTASVVLDTRDFVAQQRRVLSEAESRLTAALADGAELAGFLQLHDPDGSSTGLESGSNQTFQGAATWSEVMRLGQ